MNNNKKIEYYILCGDEGMKELLMNKGIDVSPLMLLIVSQKSEIGKLIKNKLRKEFKKFKNKIEGEKERISQLKEVLQKDG